MGPIGVLLGLGGSVVAGTAWGLKARGDDALRMDQDVQRDLDSLRGSGSLPQGVSPRFSLTPHRQKGVASRYALGIGLGGFGAWLLTLVIALALIEGTGQEAAAVEKVGSSLMVAGLFGLAGFVVPGILIGAFLWLREVRGRVREVTAEVYRLYWAERERGSAALASGQATPAQVTGALAGFHADSVDEDGHWIPSPSLTSPQDGPTELPQPEHAPASEPEPRPSPPPRPSGHVSRWFGEEGESVTFRARVEAMHPIHHESRLRPHFLYIMRTHEGDLVRWMASRDAGMESGDDITLRGTVKAHSSFNGERQTEVFYCKPTIHNVDR